LSIVLPDAYLAYTPVVAKRFCSQAEHEEVSSFFTQRLGGDPVGLQYLESILDGIQGCEARKRAVVEFAQSMVDVH
jgi:hypothetical protein